MKKFLFVGVLQGLLLFVSAVFGQNDMDRICQDACDEMAKGNYFKAKQKFDDCKEVCDECAMVYKRRRQECEWLIREQSKQSGNKLPTSSKEGDIYQITVYDTLEVVMHDTVVRMQHRIDTVFFTDNNRFVHPFFNKNIKVKKSVWYATVNGVGVAALAGSIAFGIQAQSNYKKHNSYVADTRKDHRQYYHNYRVYNGVMWGCIGLAVTAFASNFLAVQVSDEVRISPGVLMDMQGNVQASLSVRF